MKAIDDVSEEIRRNHSFAVSTHINPEGDALGSSLALALGLQAFGKKALVVNRDPVPRFLDYLPYQKVFEQRAQVTESYDVLAVLDCGELARTGLFNPQQLPAKKLINIDHHITNEKFGHINWIDIEATCTGEMVYQLLTALSIPMTPEIALCLYTSIVTETGSFRYSNTGSKTFRLAADLLAEGVKGWWVAQQLYERNTPNQLRLLGDLLGDMGLSPEGKIAWIIVKQEHFSATGTSPEDIEDFINYPRSIDGVEVAILFRELAPDRYKLSFRSKGRINVASLAEQYSGGGHRNAAGCVIQGGLEEVREKVLGSVREALRRERADSEG